MKVFFMVILDLTAGIVRNTYHGSDTLTPMYTNVSLGDVNKICFDDYAHTVH